MKWSYGYWIDAVWNWYLPKYLPSNSLIENFTYLSNSLSFPNLHIGTASFLSQFFHFMLCWAIYGPSIKKELFHLCVFLLLTFCFKMMTNVKISYFLDPKVEFQCPGKIHVWDEKQRNCLHCEDDDRHKEYSATFSGVTTNPFLWPFNRRTHYSQQLPCLRLRPLNSFLSRDLRGHLFRDW